MWWEKINEKIVEITTVIRKLIKIDLVITTSKRTNKYSRTRRIKPQLTNSPKQENNNKSK